MNLNYQQILKLKGTYLVDKSGALCYVKSSTRNKITMIGKGATTILTSIFMESKQKHYELASEKQITEEMVERLDFFLSQHGGEIRGLYNDKYSRNGGWNGTMDALNEVERRYSASIDYDYIPDRKLESLIKEYV